MTVKNTFKILALGAALLTSISAYAHGNQGHNKHAEGLKKEQTDWGIAGEAKAVKRTIHIKMTDNMRFSPDKITVKLGETVRFVVSNEGQMMHEFVIGTKKELDEHAVQMIKFPNMEHDAPYMAHVNPKAKGEIIWTFNKPGDFDFACLIAGHYQAGMVGKISVIGAKSDGQTRHKH